MPKVQDASPHITVRLYKAISRETVDGRDPVSTRYSGKDEYIDLTPYLGLGSAVITNKSTREPAGAFSVMFADRPQDSITYEVEQTMCVPARAIESIYGLVEPMDVIEIRMWGGVGSRPPVLPIKMRGFVTEVQRAQSMSGDGKPIRQVTIRGHDYGKIWQTFQVIYLAAYAEGKALLTAFGLWELFGAEAQTMRAGDFIRQIVTKIINPHIDKFMPENSPMPRELQTGDSISVAHGVVSQNYQGMQGSLYDIMRYYGDVGVWNELYTEDREDGVHTVYRPIPALHITRPEGASDSRIQDDAPLPTYVMVPDDYIVNISVSRTDANVANFYWVNNAKYDLVDDLYRKLAAVPASDSSANLKDYPNSAVMYYGVRQMYAETQQGDERILNESSGNTGNEQDTRSGQIEDWITRRRRHMAEMNRDNVVLERGAARVKGGLMREDGSGHLRAGDYAMFETGQLAWRAYVVSITDEFLPFQSYTATLQFERGENFVNRMRAGTGMFSPWLAEQARRPSDEFLNGEWGG